MMLWIAVTGTVINSEFQKSFRKVGRRRNA